MKKRVVFLLIGIGCVLVGIGSYKAVYSINPDYTCGQCHEIQKSCTAWRSSSHGDVACMDCHGTALSNGLTGLTEKMSMVYVHFTQKKTNEDVFLTEKQSLDMAKRCAKCHGAEEKAWSSGAHSTTYKDIFMDEVHNQMEKPYWDCFRCHGMFYDGDINNLMTLDGKDPAKWHIKEAEQAGRPTITCLACHQVHASQPRSAAYKDLSTEKRGQLLKKTSHPGTALYMRAEKRHMPSADLMQVKMYRQDTLVRISEDTNVKLCMQCHSPNGVHALGSEDDKTPVGTYEGMSCMDCHDPHSNKVKNEYRNVHLSLLPIHHNEYSAKYTTN